MESIRNEFLLSNVRVNGRHQRDCFCLPCRAGKVEEILNGGFTNNDLQHMFFQRLTQQEDIRLHNLFKLTLRKIVYGKAYKDSCIQNTPYKTFGWWVRSQDQFSYMTHAQIKKFCDQINEVDLVYKDWDKIVRNLTDPRMIHCDARKFSVHQFYRARDLGWCLNHNEILRNRGHLVDEPLYAENKYRNIMLFISNSGILDDINYDDQQISMLGRRLQIDMQRMSRRVEEYEEN